MSTSARHALTILAVPDVAEARAFFLAAFDWRVTVDVPIYLELATADGQRVGLYDAEGFARNTGRPTLSARRSRETAPAELYLWVPDLDAAEAAVLAAGGELLSERARRDWGDDASYFRAPGGHVLVLARPNMPPDVLPVEDGKGELCREILEGLPDWFGIAEARERYVREVEALPVLAIEAGGERVGFVALKPHSAHAAEVHVMGVRRDHHRQGLGTRLLRASECWAARQGMRWLTVKTLSPSRESPEYAQTRQFYEACGYARLEELPTLWDEANPALLLIKSL
jgi:GNAT superfamily N-acetyltransferase/predicted enzyme related to lactoylglutathione lyase